jgi:hypothetical protein
VSVQAISWVIENSKHKGGAFVVLLMIANHAHSDGTGAFPSFETLAREARITHRQVTRIIPKLRKSGELVVQRGQGPNNSNLYTVTMGRDKMSLPPRDNMSLGQGHLRLEAGTFEAKTDVTNVPLTVNKSTVHEAEPKNNPRARARETTPTVSLPDWITPGIWEAFVEMRRKIRSPLTDYAATSMIQRLKNFKAMGQVPDLLLEQAIRNSYRDVFPLREERTNGSHQGNNRPSAAVPRPEGKEYPVGRVIRND